MKRHHPDAFDVPDVGPLPVSPSRVLEILAGVITEKRLERVREVVSRRTLSVAPVLEGIADPHNASAILRSADAFGIQRIHWVPGSPETGAETFRASKTISKGTHRWLDIVRHPDAASCVAALRTEGYAIYVASMEGAVAPAELARVARVAIVFGNEHAGPSKAMRDAADGTYAIPMRGFVESLNVSVAAAITLSALTEGRPGDLSPSAQEQTVARLLYRRVPDAVAIVEKALREQAT